MCTNKTKHNGQKEDEMNIKLHKYTDKPTEEQRKQRTNRWIASHGSACNLYNIYMCLYACVCKPPGLPSGLWN